MISLFLFSRVVCKVWTCDTLDLSCSWTLAISSAAFSACVRAAVAFSQPTRRSYRNKSVKIRLVQLNYLRKTPIRPDCMRSESNYHVICFTMSNIYVQLTVFSFFNSFISCLVLHSSASLARRVFCRLPMSSADCDLAFSSAAFPFWLASCAEKSNY